MDCIDYMGMSSNRSRNVGDEDLKKIAKKKEYLFIEGFCGPGGMSLGLINSGFDLGLAFDLNEKSVETHFKNLGHKSFVWDAKELNGSCLLNQTGRKIGEIDLFAGGPPCQGFSKQKRGAHLGDSRNVLVLEFARIVNEIQPKFFIFENVAIFGQKRGKDYIDKLKSILDNYRLYPRFYNCADYGLAQTRLRFVIVGKRADLAVGFEAPKPVTRVWKTVGQVLSGLPEPPEDFSEHPDYPNHQRARVTAANIERFSYVPQGGGWQDIPMDLRLKCHRTTDVKSGGWPDVYGRLEWDGQCPTITGGFDSFTRGRYGHPLQDRPLTPREAARIQGFPDNFVFHGNRGDIRSQIGNAVPPPLAEAIGLEILRSLLNLDGVTFEEDEIKDEYEREQLKLFA